MAGKSEPKISKIQCLNLDIACTAALTFGSRLNIENLLRAPCKFQYSELNLEIGSKFDPKIYKIQCLNLEIARDEILRRSRKARILARVLAQVEGFRLGGW